MRTDMNDARLLQGKLALVTGAGQGNGRAIALGLAQAGARVVATDMNAANAQATAQAIEQAGGSAASFALDITQPQECAQVLAQVEQRLGALDILVNNAGILVRDGIDSPQATRNLQQVMKVNYEGTWNVIQASLPALRRARGAIVNVASVAAFAGWPNTLGYAPSKGAVKMLTQSLAADLARDGVRVNAIAPGVIATPMTDSTRSDPGKLERFLTRIPMARVGQPEELVGAVLFLASSMSTYVTGITVPVDGGFLTA
jgi:NAD(P)-dependent dehydrogenase (short-subunit alcohol dehydrogenase family)